MSESEIRAWWIDSDPDHPANPNPKFEPEAPLMSEPEAEPTPGPVEEPAAEASPLIGTIRSENGAREIFTGKGWLPLPFPAAPIADEHPATLPDGLMEQT